MGRRKGTKVVKKHCKKWDIYTRYCEKCHEYFKTPFHTSKTCHLCKRKEFYYQNKWITHTFHAARMKKYINKLSQEDTQNEATKPKKITVRVLGEVKTHE